MTNVGSIVGGSVEDVGIRTVNNQWRGGEHPRRAQPAPYDAIVNVWTVFAFVIPTTVVALALWGLRLQKRMYPPQRPRVREPEERNREPRWIGFIYGGGRG